MSNSPISFKSYIEYEQGDEPAEVQFMLVCRNIPVGSRVCFSADTPGPVPSIELPWTVVVATGTQFVVGVQCQVPAGYKTRINYAAEFSQPPPSGASLEMRAAMSVVVASSGGAALQPK